MTPTKLPFVVDGGYLIWTYGSNEERIEVWKNGHKESFNRSQNCTILMDGKGLLRREYFPDYKIDRIRRTQSDPERMKKRELVKHFFDDVIAKDPTLNYCTMPGHEADDTIGVFANLFFKQTGRPLVVIGTDKDLVQLGDDRIRVERHDGVRVTVPKFADKLPKTIKDFVTRPDQILACLMILGDKSDSVPPIYTPGIKGLRTVARILQEDNPFKAALNFYDQELLWRNLYMTILPGPWTLVHEISPGRLYQNICDEGLTRYYDRPYKLEFYEAYSKFITVPDNWEEVVAEDDWSWFDE